jgi:hypothetical protein
MKDIFEHFLKGLYVEIDEALRKFAEMPAPNKPQVRALYWLLTMLILNLYRLSLLSAVVGATWRTL